MPESHTPVQITADGLIVLRADRALMERVGASDPYAPWFVTEAGRRLADFAAATDPVYVVFNLARYRWFSERLIAATERFSQFVVLGAGYDTRPIHMDAFGRDTVRVFEVDVPSTLDARRRVLEAHGVALPGWVVQVPCDIGTDDVGSRLQDAGFRSANPAFVMAEGLFYYLDAEPLRSVLSPTGLGLAPGSTFQFDFWTDARTKRLNERVFAERGMRLFKPFPFAQGKAELAAALTGEGCYEDVEITPLNAIARQYWPRPHDWVEAGGWVVVSATVRTR